MILSVVPHTVIESIQYKDNCNSNISQIIPTNNLDFIEKLLESADRDTLVLWDVDQTLIVPDDAILKPKWDKLLDQMMGGKKVLADESGNKRYIFREILMSASHSLLDPKSVSLIQDLQKKGIPTIAFSAAPAGRIGKVESFVDWRIEELKRFGFDFGTPFKQYLELPKDSDLEYPPIFKLGVLITSLHDKGPVLTDFFDALHWKPKKVIFIDDQLGNVQSVVSSLEGEIPTIGIHYTAASDLPCEIDRNQAQAQVERFIQTGHWTNKKN